MCLTGSGPYLRCWVRLAREILKWYVTVQLLLFSPFLSSQALRLLAAGSRHIMANACDPTAVTWQLHKLQLQVVLSPLPCSWIPMGIDCYLNYPLQIVAYHPYRQKRGHDSASCCLLAQKYRLVQDCVCRRWVWLHRLSPTYFSPSQTVLKLEP